MLKLIIYKKYIFSIYGNTYTKKGSWLLSMSRDYRKNRFKNNRKEINKLFIGSLILIAVIVFFISYIISGNKVARQAKISNVDVIENSNLKVLNNITEDKQTSTVSSAIGRNVNEMQDEINEDIEETDKIAVNTSKIESREIEVRKAEKNAVETSTNMEDGPVVEEVLQTPEFVRPVDGEVIKDYSDSNLIYSNTLDEWTTHLGIDFAAEKTSIVKAAAAGTIKTIKNDPRYGLTLVIEHDNGYTSMYANLLSTEFVEVGEEVEKGQTIATVGNTAMFEIADETHLHFEILKDGKNIDPNLYLK